MERLPTKTSWLSILDKILLAVTALLTLVLFVYGINYKLSVMSADTMHVYNMVFDIFTLGNLKGMFIPSNPFYFPDVLVGAPIFIITRNLYAFHAMYFCVVFLAFFLLLARGLKFHRTQQLLFAAFCTVEMIKFTFDSYFYPNHHFGAFLVVLYCIVAISTQRHLWFLPVVVLAGVYSDAFLVPWLLAPLAIYAAVLLFNKFYKSLGPIAVCIAAGVAGHFLHTQEVSLLGEIHPQFIKKPVLAANFSEWKSNFQLVAEATGYLLRKNAPLVLIVVGISLLGFQLARKRWQDHYDFRLAVLCLASVVSTIGFLLVTKIFIDTSNLRYAMPAIWLPIIYFFYCYPQFPKIAQRALILFLIVCQITVLSSYVTAKQSFIAEVDKKELCVKEFIDSHPIELAIGDYWHAKLYQFTVGLPIVPVEQDLTYNGFATNKYWYLEAAQTSPLNLVFINGLDREKATAAFGSPTDVQKCGETEMWFFASGVLSPQFSQDLYLQIRQK